MNPDFCPFISFINGFNVLVQKVGGGSKVRFEYNTRANQIIDSYLGSSPISAVSCITSGISISITAVV